MFICVPYSGADLISGDGIYSAYFLDFSSNGRYGVKVDVNGNTATLSDSEFCHIHVPTIV